MADAKDLKRAKEVYEQLCKALDNVKWHYGRDDENLILHFSVNGEDIPMEFIMVIDAERKLVRMLSLLPFVAEPEHVEDVALATSWANYRMADGSFDFNVKEGKIIYRMTSSFRESLISDDVLIYMVQYACYAVDKYNDQLFMLAKGNITIDQFIKANS